MSTVTTKRTRDGFRPYDVYVDGKRYGWIGHTSGSSFWTLHTLDGSQVAIEFRKRDLLKLLEA